VSQGEIEMRAAGASRPCWAKTSPASRWIARLAGARRARTESGSARSWNAPRAAIPATAAIGSHAAESLLAETPEASAAAAARKARSSIR
jgi:hypothetical protein